MEQAYTAAGCMGMCTSGLLLAGVFLAARSKGLMLSSHLVILAVLALLPLSLGPSAAVSNIQIVLKTESKATLTSITACLLNFMKLFVHD